MKRKMAAHDIKHIPFPDCYEKCSIVNILGVSECDFVCPFKFIKEEEGGETNAQKENMRGV